MIMESQYRSTAKAVTWRAGGTVVTYAVAWILSQDLSLSAGIGLLNTAVRIGAFYVHEHMWNRLSFGGLKPPEYQI